MHWHYQLRVIWSSTCAAVEEIHSFRLGWKDVIICIQWCIVHRMLLRKIPQPVGRWKNWLTSAAQARAISLDCSTSTHIWAWRTMQIGWKSVWPARCCWILRSIWKTSLSGLALRPRGSFAESGSGFTMPHQAECECLPQLLILTEEYVQAGRCRR